MQLNPARGRKLKCVASGRNQSKRVYAAQPREGTETLDITIQTPVQKNKRFMQLNPARGRKRL